jgi:hypothetical protein
MITGGKVAGSSESAEIDGGASATIVARIRHGTGNSPVPRPADKVFGVHGVFRLLLDTLCLPKQVGGRIRH